MAAKPSIKVVKETSHRGSTRHYSNRYHFDGGTPAGTSAWHTLAENLLPYERALIFSSMHVVEMVGYDAGSDVPVWSEAFTAAGTASYDSSDQPAPSDVAALLRYTTTQRTSKNHPIYLFNYFHNAVREESGPLDQISVELKGEIDAYGTAWLAGFSDGAHTLVRCGPNGAVAQTRSTGAYLTHRDFSN